MKEGNIIAEKSMAFAIRIVKLCQFLNNTHHEYVLSKQIMRSGTSIGALVRESEHAQSKADFISKMSIALKEANETEYWLILLKETDYLDENLFNSLIDDCKQLLRILISIIKTTKEKE